MRCSKRTCCSHSISSIPLRKGNLRQFHPFNVINTGEQFHDKREDRILIFATCQSLLFLQNSDDWFLNGTFSTVPPQFLQLCTIHGTHHLRNVVGTYCLLTHKHQETYAEVLRQLKHLTNNVVPHSIMDDFEPPLIKISFSPTKSVYSIFLKA